MTATTEVGHNLWDFSTAEAVTAWAALIALVLAAVTAVIALWQMRETRRISRNVDAQESYRSYLEVSLNNPELATPNLTKIRLDQGLKDKYDWFVAYLLAASEKILEIAGNDGEWISTIKLNVGYHQCLLRDTILFENTQLECYNKNLRKLIFEKTGRRLPEDAHLPWRKDGDVPDEVVAADKVTADRKCAGGAIGKVAETSAEQTSGVRER